MSEPEVAAEPAVEPAKPKRKPRTKKQRMEQLKRSLDEMATPQHIGPVIDQVGSDAQVVPDAVVEQKALESVQAAEAVRHQADATQIGEQIAAVHLPEAPPPPPAPHHDEHNGHTPAEVQQAAAQARKFRPEIAIVLGGGNVLHAGFAKNKETEKNYAWLFSDKKMDPASLEELKDEGYRHGNSHVWWLELGENRWEGVKQQRAFIEQLANKVREGNGLSSIEVMGKAR